MNVLTTGHKNLSSNPTKNDRAVTIYPHPPQPGFDIPVGEKMKQRQTKVEETDLWETIIRVEAQNKA